MDDTRQIMVTLGLCIGLVALHFSLEPVQDVRTLGTLPEAFLGVLRHGSLQHVAGNLLVIFFGGLFAEPRLGSRGFCLLVLASAAMGTLAQFTLAGPHFVGASSISYGVLAYGVIAERPRSHQWLAISALGTLLVMEWAWLWQSVAVYAHIFGAISGGSLAMFEALFGSKTPTLKPMQTSHIPRVVQIIAETDSDDAHEAEDEFREEGVQRMFVLMQRGEVLGATGYSLDEQADDIAWLSWTYLAREHTGAGLGSQMLNDLLGTLNGYGVRKIFVATSDYQSRGRPIYAAAHKMYEDFGAEVELTVPDYHAPGEARIVYGLNNPEFVCDTEAPGGENSGIAFVGMGPEPETGDVLGLQWEERPAGLAGLDHAIETARGRGARMLVAALPSDLSEANADALSAHEFERCGQLREYHHPDLHQDWWVCSLREK